MKLYEVPEHKELKIKLKDDLKNPPAHRQFKPDEILIFSHIDGLYSLCYDADGKPVHLAAWAEVEIVAK